MNGEPNGRGERTYPNGDIYVGDFIHGKRHGDGKLTRPKDKLTSKASGLMTIYLIYISIHILTL